MRSRSLATLVLALAATSCDEAPSPAASLQPGFSAVGHAPSVSGGGKYDLTPAGASLASFNYDVTQNDDGTASGTFHLFFEADGAVVDFDGSATCVSVDAANRRGWVGGVITANRSTHPSFMNPLIHAVGADVWFRVVDYGEGNAAASDRSTTFGFRGSAGIITSEEYCRVMPWPALDARTWPVVAGNIQVRP